MLFKIEQDTTDARNVAEYYPKVVKRLMYKLFSAQHLKQYAAFNMNTNMPSKLGVSAQIEVIIVKKHGVSFELE